MRSIITGALLAVGIALAGATGASAVPAADMVATPDTLVTQVRAAFCASRWQCHTHVRRHGNHCHYQRHCWHYHGHHHPGSRCHLTKGHHRITPMGPPRPCPRR